LGAGRKSSFLLISEGVKLKNKVNFGDILDQWGSGIIDKDAEGPEETGGSSLADQNIHWNRGEPPAQKRRRLHLKKPDATIDIHGLTRDEAWNSLELFFKEAKSQGFEKLLIIHGKGNHSEGEAVLKRSTREFIERCPFAGESGHGNAVSGGSGATWVLLKQDFSAPGR
jgi:DNA-nicking Smr family endonuclease